MTTTIGTYELSWTKESKGPLTLFEGAGEQPIMMRYSRGICGFTTAGRTSYRDITQEVSSLTPFVKEFIVGRESGDIVRLSGHRTTTIHSGKGDAIKSLVNVWKGAAAGSDAKGWLYMINLEEGKLEHIVEPQTPALKLLPGEEGSLATVHANQIQIWERIGSSYAVEKKEDIGCSGELTPHCISAPYPQLRFIAGDKGGKLQVFPKEGEVSSCEGHEGAITGLLAVGDKVVSASVDKTVRVWEWAKGMLRECTVLEGHEEGITHMVPLSDRVATASEDKTVRIWDVQEGQCVQTLETGKVESMIHIAQVLAIATKDKLAVWKAHVDGEGGSE